MRQLPLPGMSGTDRPAVVNVASVPQRSPFRYPGGKTWLVPTIRRWLLAQGTRPSLLVEPFAGGAIIGLTAAFEGLADHVMLIERDVQVAAVWQTIIETEDGPWLADQIAHFACTEDNVAHLLTSEPPSIRERALQTIVKNRVNRGGILAAGAGRIKSGEDGRGLASRWYPQTLQRRILDIVAIRDRLSFRHDDGMAVLEAHESSDAVFFIDPPYTASRKTPGSRLYDHAVIDHTRLFELAKGLRGDFVMSYDNDAEVHRLAEHAGFEVTEVAMKSTHHARRTELLIGKRLDWIR